jgi:hypothetical protein
MAALAKSAAKFSVIKSGSNERNPPSLSAAMSAMAAMAVTAAMAFSMRPICNVHTSRIQRRCNIAANEAHATVIFLRHGQSTWNEASLFTGWANVELTTLGKNEAARGATDLWKAGFKIDVAYTSRLKRAQQTLDIVLQITGQEDVPIQNSWRLNERMYGALTGLNKKETAAKFGQDQVKIWRKAVNRTPDHRGCPAARPTV